MAKMKTVIAPYGDSWKFGSDVKGLGAYESHKPEDQYLAGRICVVENTYSGERCYVVTDVIPVENRSPLLDILRDFFNDETADTLDLRLEPLAQSVAATEG